MDLDTIPNCSLEAQGVSFKYLVFTLKAGDRVKRILRGVNFRPYDSDATERITGQLKSELAHQAIDISGDGLQIDGGGTASVNPYYETVTVFGENNEYGAESDREAVLEMLKASFPGFAVSSYQPGEEEEAPKPVKKKAPPRPTAKPVAKKAGAESGEEEQDSSHLEEPASSDAEDEEEAPETE